ncbi:unnamed protein product [Linum trigynum]|uniref:Uncharacterized protein n=1 Tax=Linum trigynum TaxID=586398 RepID=A0AAV2EHM5_9ROSI
MRPSFASLLAALVIFFLFVAQPRFVQSRTLLKFRDHANSEVAATATSSASGAAAATDHVERASEKVKDHGGGGGEDPGPAAVVKSNLASGPSRKGEGH